MSATSLPSLPPEAALSSDELLFGEPSAATKPLGTSLAESPALWAERLSFVSERQSSATAKARALAAAALLSTRAGQAKEAALAAERAAQTQPRLALLTLLSLALADDSGPSELALYALEQSFRKSDTLSARTYALRRALELCQGRGDVDRARNLLEHGSRTLDDSFINAERLFFALALGEPTAGLKVPPALSSSWPIAREIADRTEADGDVPAGIPLLRALRARRSGDVSGFIERLGQYLVRTPEPPPALRHVWLLLMSAHPAGGANARALLKEKAPVDPTPFTLRLLAYLSLEEDDREGLKLALDSDRDGTFSFEERALLARMAGLPAPDDQQGARSPALVQALKKSPASESDPLASARALLGAHLGRLTSSEGRKVVEEWQRLEGGSHSEILLSLLDLETQRQNGSEDPEPLRVLSELTSDPELSLLLGFRRATSGDAAGAEAAFEQAWTATNPRVRAAALLGLASQKGPSRELAHRRVELGRQLDIKERTPLFFEAALDLDTVESAALLRELAESPEGPTLTKETALFLSFLLERIALPGLARGEALEALLELEGASLRDAAATLLALFANDTDDRVNWLGRVSARAQALPLFQLLRASTRIGVREEDQGSGTSLDVVHRAATAWLDGDSRQALAELTAPVVAESPLFRAFQRHLELHLGEAASSTVHLLEHAPQDGSPDARRDTLQALIHYDAARGDGSSAAMWRNILVHEGLATLGVHMDIEHRALETGDLQAIRSLFPELIPALPLADRDPYLLVEAAFALGSGDLRGARRALEQLGEPARLPLFALRALTTDAWDRADLLRVRELERELATRHQNPEDVALLRTELARLSLARGETEEALSDLEIAIEAAPSAFAPRLLRVEAIDAREDGEDEAEMWRDKAQAADAVAGASHSDEHRLLALARAGDAFERAQDPESARNRFERCLELEPDSLEAFTRLHHLYQGHDEALVGLLLRRLEQPLTPHARLELALEAGELLMKAGRAEEAERLYGETLKAHPSDPRVLGAHARSAEAISKYAEACLSYKRLAQASQSDEARISALYRVARISSEKLKKFEAAMDAYETIVSLRPESLTAMRELVAVFLELELAERAAELQTKVIARTEATDDKIWAVLELAEIYRTAARDPGRAAATLERAGRAWPLDSRVLSARAELLAELGETQARRMLVDRTAKEARRQLESGRLELGILETVGLATDLLGGRAQAEATYAALRVLRGEPEAKSGGSAGPLALAPELDPFLRPKELPRALGELLRKTKEALDLTLPLDATSARPAPASSPTLQALSRALTAAGSPKFELLTSDALGPRVLVLSSHPLRFIAGTAVDALSEGVRSFLVLRAVKQEQMGAGALFRGKAEGAWPTLVALLLIFAPNFRPEGADARRVMQAQAQLERGFARLGYDDDVPTLALEAVGALGRGGASVYAALGALAQRAAFLGVGSLEVSLSALALETRPIPSDGPARLRWFETIAEAKDLLLFSTSENMQRAIEALSKRSAPR
ncbi:MAG: hypothetical protein B6A08_01855 [Sorangiineae bacterium NIC37A_2]|jgi:tetratricopeptide (TPR) repeat protein|nr:MAG: hypothetical protein B6A08_19150 [Sorangiineae bacterium NIC37A_2]OQX69933.1 MAG: hypothetical protein B6A08_01855 [Sorangiineae bacterium NIC37A_2]